MWQPTILIRWHLVQFCLKIKWCFCVLVKETRVCCSSWLTMERKGFRNLTFFADYVHDKESPLDHTLVRFIGTLSSPGPDFWTSVSFFALLILARILSSWFSQNLPPSISDHSISWWVPHLPLFPGWSDFPGLPPARVLLDGLSQNLPPSMFSLNNSPFNYPVSSHPTWSLAINFHSFLLYLELNLISLSTYKTPL